MSLANLHQQPGVDRVVLAPALRSHQDGGGDDERFVSGALHFLGDPPRLGARFHDDTAGWSAQKQVANRLAGQAQGTAAEFASGVHGAPAGAAISEVEPDHGPSCDFPTYQGLGILLHPGHPFPACTSSAHCSAAQ